MMPDCTQTPLCYVQSGGSQLESMQLLLTDARQHAADLQADNSHLQHTQDSLQKALAQACFQSYQGFFIAAVAPAIKYQTNVTTHSM